MTLAAYAFVDTSGRYIEDRIEDDEQGKVIEVYESNILVGYTVAERSSKALYRPVFDVKKWKENPESNVGDLWIEGLSQEEIKEIQNDFLNADLPTSLEGAISELKALQKRTDDVESSIYALMGML